MASRIYPKFIERVMENTLPNGMGSLWVYCALVKDGTYTFDEDDDTVQDVLQSGGADECDVASYQRRLVSDSINSNYSGGHVGMSFSFPDFGSLEAGNTIGGMLMYYREAQFTDNDPTNKVMAWHDGTTDAMIVGKNDLSHFRFITVSSNTNPVVITTSSDHDLTTGDAVHITGNSAMTEINNRWFYVTVLTPTTFELDNENGTGYSAGGGGLMEYAPRVYLDRWLPTLEPGQAVGLGVNDAIMLHQDPQNRWLICRRVQHQPLPGTTLTLQVYNSFPVATDGTSFQIFLDQMSFRIQPWN